VGDSGNYRRLFRLSISAIAVSSCLIAFCYFFVDKPVAYFVHDHHFARFALLKWPTYPPPLLQDWAPVALVGLAVRRAWGPFRSWELTLLAACVSLLVAVQFKDGLKYVCGRYWPETWTANNPSLIKDGAYGFHPFHGSLAYASFPSGHTARTLAIVSVVWIRHPRGRWVCAVAVFAVVVGLIGMNYHFVSDVIAGGVLGGIVGMYAAQSCPVARP
jgi:membrane-associated phospholipid phosphatase